MYFKWRFYYEDYEPDTKHTPLWHIEWALNGCDSGAARGNPMACRHIEYDVPKAAEGTPPEEAIHEVRSQFKVSDMVSPDCDFRVLSLCLLIGQPQN